MKIITSLLVLFICFTSFVSADDRPLEERVKYFASEIKKELEPTRWSIQIEGESISITSKFKIGKVSRKSKKLYYANQVPQEQYVIQLDFREGLTEEEYRKLSIARAKQAAIYNYASYRSAESGTSAEYLIQNPLPRYTVTSRTGVRTSVYLTSTDDHRCYFIPTSKYAEAKSVVAIIDNIMGYDPN